MGNINIFGHEIFSWNEKDSKVKHTLKNALSSNSNTSQVGSLSLDMMRRVALREPLILKAINKKNKDLLRNWFELKPKEGDENVSVRILNILNRFDEQSNIRYKFFVAGVSANIYGTGFLEIIFSNDNGGSDSPVSEKSRPVNLRVLDSECIKERKYKDGDNKTLFWVYREPNDSDDTLIHPDRVIDLATDKLPFSEFGISKINILANVLTSKLNADVAAGETLAWFSTGVLDMTITGMDDEQEKAMLKLFNEHPHYYAHDEDYVLDIKNPTRIDPKPFYDYFYTNIAAVMEMPVSLLVGTTGGSSGADGGMFDYYHDVENIQELILSPAIKKIYERLLKVSGFNWNYVIKWNPLFVDELAEGKIMQVRSFSAVNAKNAGVIDVSEARNILVNGVVDLDINKVPKVEPSTSVGGSPTQPNVQPQPSVKKPTSPVVKASIPFVVEPLSPISKRMIEEAARRERELGKEILAEQEVIFKKKPKKKKKVK